MAERSWTFYLAIKNSSHCTVWTGKYFTLGGRSLPGLWFRPRNF